MVITWHTSQSQRYAQGLQPPRLLSPGLRRANSRTRRFCAIRLPLRTSVSQLARSAARPFKTDKERATGRQLDRRFASRFTFECGRKTRSPTTDWRSMPNTRSLKRVWPRQPHCLQTPRSYFRARHVEKSTPPESGSWASLSLFVYTPWRYND